MKDIKYTFQHGFPAFTSVDSKTYLIKHPKIRVSELWSFWDFIVKIHCSKRGDKAKLNFFNSLIEQAKYFYKAAEDAPLKSKPLLFYYSFLNLAKIIINIKNLQLPVSVEYNHGIETSVNSSTKIDNAVISIKQLGSVKRETNITIWSVAKMFFEEMGDNLSFQPNTPYQIQLMDCMRQCIGIHRTFCETFNEEESFFRLKFPKDNQGEDCILKQGSIITCKATIDNCSKNNVSTLISKGYNITTNGRKNEYIESYNMGNGVYSINRQHWVHLSKQVMSKGLWSYTDGKEYRSYISTHKYPLSSASIIYVIMFFFGSITRYHPYLFENFLDKKEQWLVSEFLNTQPKQFMYLVTSKVISNNIYNSGASNITI